MKISLLFVLLFAFTTILANDDLPIPAILLTEPVRGDIDTSVNSDFDGDGSIEKMVVKNAGEFGYLLVYDYDGSSAMYQLLEMGGGEAGFANGTCTEIRGISDYTGNGILDIHFLVSGCGSGGTDYIFTNIDGSWFCVLEAGSDLGGIKLIEPGKLSQKTRIYGPDIESGQMIKEISWTFNAEERKFIETESKVIGDMY